MYLGDTELHLAPGDSTPTGVRTYSAGGLVLAERSTTAGVAGSHLVFLDANPQGTSTATIDTTDAQTVAWRYFDPFGNPRGPVGAWPSNHGFLNKPTDTFAGLTHLGARDYDPTAGRFLTVDPILDTASPQQMNGYSYGNNNPIVLSDPAGTDPAGGCSFWDNRRCGPHNHAPSCGSSASCDHGSGADQYVPPPGSGAGWSDPRSAAVANAPCKLTTGHPCTGTPEFTSWALKQIELGELNAALNEASGGGVMANLSILGNFVCGLTGGGGGPDGQSGPCGGKGGNQSYKAGDYASWLLILLPGGEGKADGRAASKAAAGAARTANTGGRSVDEVLNSLPKGKQSFVRTVPDEQTLQSTFGELTRGGTPMTWKNYSGQVFEREDGIQVGMRGTSTSGGSTIDIRIPGQDPFKIHIG